MLSFTQSLLAMIVLLSALSSSLSIETESSLRRTVANNVRSASSESCAAIGNGTTYNGYQVSCSTDYPGGDLSNASSVSFAGCALQCDKLQGCIGFAYVGGSSAGTCYFKSLRTGGSPNQNVDFGLRIASPGSCVAAGDGTTSNGYKISCSTDFAGGDLSYASSPTFSGCATKCDTLPGCLGFSYVGGQSSGTCYFKSSQGKGSINADVDSGFKPIVTSSPSTATAASSSRSTSRFSSSTTTASVSSGRTTSPASSSNTATFLSSSNTVSTTSSSKTATLVSSTKTATTKSTTPVVTSVKCPDSNGSNYLSGGKTFRIDCATDYYGNDISSVDVGTAENSFNKCIDACASTARCVSVNLSGSACYLKSAVGNAMVNQGVSGARIIVADSSTTASTHTSTFATSTTKASSSTSISTSGASSSVGPTSRSSTASLSSSTPSSSKTASNITSSATSSKASSTGSRTSSSTTSSTPSATPVRNSGKRGLPYNNDTLTTPFSLAGQNSQVSWAYNWFYERQPSAPDYQTNRALTYVPTLFNDEPNRIAAWPAKAQAAINDGADVIFSFNEPDFCYDGSACMTINQSVTAYKSSIMPFAGKARLGAPAVTDQGGSGGLQYLEDFMGNCTGCHFDFINLHWYNNMYAYEYFKTYMTAAHKRFPNYPIYITEFGDNSNSGDAQTQTFLKQVLPWMDAVS